MAHFIHIQFAENGRGTIKLAVMMPTELEVDDRQLSRVVGVRVRGRGAKPNQFTISQGGRGRLCTHHIRGHFYIT